MLFSFKFTFLLLSLVVFACSSLIPIYHGWQMVGNSGQMNSMKDFNRSEIAIIWFYNDDSKQWEAFSGNSIIAKSIENSGFKMLDSLPIGSAVWVYGNMSGHLKLDTTDTNTTLHIHSGWQLASTKDGIDDMGIFDKVGIDSVWAYNGLEESWKLYNHSFNLYSSKIKPLNLVRDSEGFWIKSSNNIVLDTSKYLDINDSDNNISPSSNAYNYNSDNTALLKINQQTCNEWQKSIDINISDITAREKYYKNYVANAFKTVQNQPIIYAPRGEAGDFNVTVVDGVLDFSNYKLPGDITGDGSVDITDVNQLINTLSMSSYITPSTTYDVNLDGIVDTRDLLYVIARLTTQVASFDFYTVDGDKLPIDSKSWLSEHKITDLNNSTPSIVRVIVRDENGASSVNDPKINKDEWHKQINKTLNKSFEGCDMDITSISSIFAAPKSKYVIGYLASIGYVGTAQEGDQIVKNNLKGCFNTIKNLYLASNIHSYFTPTNMENLVKFGKDKSYTRMAIQDGYRVPLGVIKDIDFVNQSTKDIMYELTGDDTSVKKSSININNKTIFLYQIVHVTVVYLESQKIYSAFGKITRDSSDKYQDCGQINFHRYGPARQITDIKNNLQKVSAMQTKYQFQKNLPIGHYHQTSIIWPKGSEYRLKKEFIIYKDKTNEENFQIPWKPKSIRGHVFDKYDKPIKNKQLVLQSTCDNTLKKYATSDNLGFYEFKDVDIGEYEILMDNIPKVTVAQKGKDADADVVDDKTSWQIKIKVKGFATNGTISVKKFKIDCENPNSNPGDSEILGKICTEVEQDNDKITFTYSGKLSSDSLHSPLTITTKGVEFGAKYNYEGGIFELGAFPYEKENHNTYTFCNGLFPESTLEDIKNGNKIHFTSYGVPITCEFILEPCKNIECKDEKENPPFNDFGDF